MGHHRQKVPRTKGTSIREPRARKVRRTAPIHRPTLLIPLLFHRPAYKRVSSLLKTRLNACDDNSLLSRRSRRGANTPSGKLCRMVSVFRIGRMWAPTQVQCHQWRHHRSFATLGFHREYAVLHTTSHIYYLTDCYALGFSPLQQELIVVVATRYADIHMATDCHPWRVV